MAYVKRNKGINGEKRIVNSEKFDALAIFGDYAKGSIIV